MSTFDGRHHGRRGRAGSCGGPVRPLFNDASRSKKPNYKTTALCKQVRRAVALALAGECGDPVLQELVVDEVLPAPHAARLLVRVRFPARAHVPSVVEVFQRLGKRRREGRYGARIARFAPGGYISGAVLVGPSPLSLEVTP